MKKLTKKEIREASTMQLTMRFNRLMLMGDTMVAEEIPISAAKEVLWIEDELHRRLIKAVGHDFYPPNRR